MNHYMPPISQPSCFTTLILELSLHRPLMNLGFLFLANVDGVHLRHYKDHGCDFVEASMIWKMLASKLLASNCTFS